MSEENRLDKLEALAEKILEGLAQTRQGLEETRQRLEETRQRLEETRQRTDSNARAIQALTESISQEKEERRREHEEWKKDRKQMYEWMAPLSASQANFWEIQADYYRRLEDVEDRQTTMLEILDRLTQRTDSNASDERT